MLAVVHSAHCAIIASRLAIGREIRRWAMLDAHLCSGPLRTAAALRRSEAWVQLARVRNHHWTHLTGADPEADWMEVSPRAVRRAESVLVAVEDDSNGWLLLALLTALCGPELPPSRWKVAWCVDSVTWGRGGTTLEPPRVLSMEERRLAAKLWTAATQQTPHALAQLASAPVVGRSARHILEQLPEEESGLTAVERHLIELAMEEERQVGSLVGHTLMDFSELMNFSEDPHHVVARIERLVAGGALRFTSTEASRWDRRVAPTPLGHELVAGQRNFVDLAGVSETVAGIRQSSEAGGVWFRTACGGVVHRACRVAEDGEPRRAPLIGEP